MTRVSVILPVHNGRDLVADTIRSVLRQENADLELWMVDDGSSDGTREIPAGFGDGRVRVLALPRRRGVSAARNAGLARAAGDYVAFIDAGDTLLPGALSGMLAAADADVVIAGYQLDVTEDLQAMGAAGEEPFAGNALELSVDGGRFAASDMPALLNVLLNNDLFHPLANKLYRRSALRGAAFDETVFFQLEDELFNLAVFGRIRDAVLIPEPAARINTTHPGSLSVAYDDDRAFNLAKLAAAYDRLLNAVGCSGDSELAANRDRQIMYHYLSLLANLKKALAFAHPTALMYEAEDLLRDEVLLRAAGGVDLRREMLVATLNAAANHLLPGLRRRSFIREKGKGVVESLVDILAAAKMHNGILAEALREPAVLSGARPEDAECLASRLWSEFNV